MKLSALVVVLVQSISGESGSIYSKDSFDKIAQAIYAPFTPYRMNSFEYGDDTSIDQNQHIRLTPDRINARGYLWSKELLPQDNWQVEFEFKVFSEDQQANGDGFAFWATESRMKKGPVYGNQDNFKGIGVLFDNYGKNVASKKSHHLYGIIGNGETHYNIKDHTSNSNIGNCYIHHKSSSGSSPLKARVTYVKQKFLEVDLQMNPESQWTKCFVAKGITLPKNIYMGFTAQNRNSHDNHDLISVTATSSNHIIYGSYGFELPPTEEEQKTEHILPRFLIIVAIVLILSYIYKRLEPKKDLSKKRY